MQYKEPTAQTTYNTEISGENNTNFIGGSHIHNENHIHPERTIARPILTQRGTQTFVGRSDELKTLHELLQGEAQVAIAAAASGMGGVGKTELAVQYAREHDGDYPAGVWWLSGGDVVGQVLSYGVRMGLPMTGTDSTPEQKVQECYDFWCKGLAGRRLVIIDDVTTIADYAAIQPYLPADPTFRVLITTRERLQLERVDLDVWSEKEAIEFLGRLLGAERVMEAGASKVCEWLGYLPLAVELVGRYLVSQGRLSFETLLGRLEDSRLKARSLLRGQPMTSTHESLAAAFEVSWGTLEEQPRILGAFVSLFGLAAIPQDVLVSCFEHWEEEDLNEAWSRLVNLHLVGSDERLHTLVREFLTVKLDEMVECGEMRSRYAEAIVALADQHCEYVMTLTQIETADVYIDHWNDFVERQSEETFGISIASVCMRLEIYYSTQGLYDLALEPSERALDIREQQLGAEHPDTRTSLNNLATLHHSMGRYAETELLYKRALLIAEQQLGPDHSSTGSSLNNLAALYYSMGRYAEAETLYQRVLSIAERQLGPGHLSTGISLNNLALLYYSVGRYEEAETLFQRALSIAEQQLGPDHPSTGTRLNNLAGLYYSMGRYSEAEPLFRRALFIAEQQLGSDHLGTGNSLNGLALLYESMNRYSEAELLSQRALSIAECKLGLSHPDTGTRLNNLAELYRSIGRYAEAEPLYQRALTIAEQQLGPDHPDTGTRLNNLAALYYAVDRFPEAAAMMSRALSVWEKVGHDHPNTQKTRVNLRMIEKRLN